MGKSQRPESVPKKKIQKPQALMDIKIGNSQDYKSQKRKEVVGVRTCVVICCLSFYNIANYESNPV